MLESLGIEMPVEGTAAEARIVSVTGMLVVTGEGAGGAGADPAAGPAGEGANVPRPAGAPPGDR
jgi:hypothetical protein